MKESCQNPFLAISRLKKKFNKKKLRWPLSSRGGGKALVAGGTFFCGFPYNNTIIGQAETPDKQNIIIFQKKYWMLWENKVCSFSVFKQNKHPDSLEVSKRNNNVKILKGERESSEKGFPSCVIGFTNTEYSLQTQNI